MIFHITYRSKVYIHLKYIGPHNLTSLTICTIRWTMMSKKDGGKNISNSHKITTISFWSSSSFDGSMTLQQMEEKNEHKRVKVCLTFFGKIPWIATNSNCCIKMLQSCYFNPINFKSCIALGSSHLRNILVALSHPLDIDKNWFFHLLTWCNRLGANMYAYRLLWVPTCLVCSSQSNLNEHLDHHSPSR